jgi:hypothetical protein
MNFPQPHPTPYPALTEYCPGSLHYAEGFKGKGKGKVHAITGHEGPEVE